MLGLHFLDKDFFVYADDMSLGWGHLTQEEHYMPIIRIHCRQEDGEVVTYTPTGEEDFRHPTDFVAYLMAQEQEETVTVGCVIAEYVREEEKPTPVFTTYQHFDTRVIRRVDGGSNGLGLVAADLAHCMDGVTGEDTSHWSFHHANAEESSVWSDVDLDDHSKAYCKVLNEWAARHNVEIYD